MIDILIQDLFGEIIKYAAMIIEFLGVVIVIVAVIRGFYQLAVIRKFNFREAGADALVSSGLSTALEILLAAEILKTLIVRSTSQIIEVGALIIIRIFLTLIIHWELIQKERHVAVKQKEMNQEKVRQCVEDLEMGE
ncbi:DUF1622 domain-containing protein [Microaceticoccus formicicus]|uniref:DUF1622 domain-containing protein n=1 Tax=Microaceticoccus formicicus TaxID=3118105 RepID=UPI003CD047CE|nr:DUF1622 domain-containing protein [Peptoniphilaceae bacterium AMB_02]